jgi:DNA-binding response OmpR family regulator
VLVIDDEPAVRKVLEAALRQEGFLVWSAQSAVEGVALYREHGTVIGLVLLDVRMPDIDGPQAMSLLRPINPQLRFCFISGDTGPYSEAELRGMGAAEIFSKPFSLHEVLRCCRQLTSTERRFSPRLNDHPIKVVVGPETSWHRESSVKDRSQGGVALWGQQPLPVGVRLRIRPVDAVDPEPWAQLEVRHCCPQASGWVLGCQYVAAEADRQSLFPPAGP